jgi:flavorubredoxin
LVEINKDEAVAVTRDIYWVGFDDPKANLHCNPYLLMDDDDVILIDPGSIPHFPIVMRKVIDLVNPNSITGVIASHQDPDVCSNLPVLEDVIARPDLIIIGHSNTNRLVKHFGVSSDFYDVDKNDFKLTLKSGRVLEFIFTPYLHSPGAIATYDTKSRTLFSSDIFGALDEDWTLFSGDNFPQCMDSWHQIYMPNNQNLRACMERLEKLDIQRILPQHGSVIENEQVQVAINHLKELPCGLDLMKE